MKIASDSDTSLKTTTFITFHSFHRLHRQELSQPMPNITITVPESLKQQMDALPELNWSETIRAFLTEKVKRAQLLQKLDKMLENSELTEEDCLALGEQVKAGMIKRYKAKGW